MGVSRETIEKMIYDEFVKQVHLLGFKVIEERDKTALINSLYGIHITAKLKPCNFTAVKMCFIASVYFERGLY